MSLVLADFGSRFRTTETHWAKNIKFEYCHKDSYISKAQYSDN